MRFFRRLIFGPFTVLRWSFFLFTPWMLYAGVLVYSYLQIPPDDRETDYVAFVYSVGMLYKALLIQFPLIALGFYLKRLFRRTIRTFRFIHFFIACTLFLGLMAGTIFVMYESYQYLHEQIS